MIKFTEQEQVKIQRKPRVFNSIKLVSDSSLDELLKQFREEVSWGRYRNIAPFFINTSSDDPNVASEFQEAINRDSLGLYLIDNENPRDAVDVLEKKLSEKGVMKLDQIVDSKHWFTRALKGDGIYSFRLSPDFVPQDAVLSFGDELERFLIAFADYFIRGIKPYVINKGDSKTKNIKDLVNEEIKFLERLESDIEGVQSSYNLVVIDKPIQVNGYTFKCALERTATKDVQSLFGTRALGVKDSKGTARRQYVSFVPKDIKDHIINRKNILLSQRYSQSISSGAVQFKPVVPLKVAQPMQASVSGNVLHNPQDQLATRSLRNIFDQYFEFLNGEKDKLYDIITEELDGIKKDGYALNEENAKEAFETACLVCRKMCELFYQTKLIKANRLKNGGTLSKKDREVLEDSYVNFISDFVIGYGEALFGDQNAVNELPSKNLIRPAYKILEKEGVRQPTVVHATYSMILSRQPTQRKHLTLG